MPESILYTYNLRSELYPQLATIKALGVDVIMNYGIWNNVEVNAGGSFPESMDDYMDTLAAAGLKAAVSLHIYTGGSPDYTSIDLIVSRYKNHSALYAWYTDDERTGAEYPVATRIAVYNYIKARDPITPIWEANYQISTNYSRSAHDIYSIHRYPFDDYTTDAQALADFESYIITDEALIDPSEDRLSRTLQTCGSFATMRVPGDGYLLQCWNLAQAYGWDTNGPIFYSWDVPAFFRNGNPYNEFPPYAPYTYMQQDIADVNATLPADPIVGGQGARCLDRRSGVFIISGG